MQIEPKPSRYHVQRNPERKYVIIDAQEGTVIKGREYDNIDQANADANLRNALDRYNNVMPHRTMLIQADKDTFSIAQMNVWHALSYEVAKTLMEPAIRPDEITPRTKWQVFYEKAATNRPNKLIITLNVGLGYLDKKGGE